VRLRVSRMAAACIGVCAGAAYADPITIASIIGSALVAGGTYAVAGWALIIGATVFGAVKARRDAKSAAAAAKAAYNGSLQDRTATLLTADPAQRIVYGRAIVGCDILAMFTTDKTGFRENGSTFTRPDALKHLVLHVASHEVQAIHEIYIGGIPLGTLDGNGIPVANGTEWRRDINLLFSTFIAGGGSVAVNPPAVSILQATTGHGGGGDNFSVQDVLGSCAITGGGSTITGPDGANILYLATITQSFVRAQIHLGTSGQTVDTYLNSVAPSQWTANHRLRGRAYVVLTLDLENPRFQGGPPGITFDVSGRKIFNPVSGLTVWTDNAALVIRDYLLAKWGYNTSTTSLDTTTWNTAIADCDVRKLAAVQVYASVFTVNITANTIVFTSARTFNTGDGVRLTNGGGTLPAPLAGATTYYVIRSGVDVGNLSFQLATSLANALAGTAIDITNTGSGTHTCTLYDYAAYTINGMVFANESKDRVLEEFARAMGGSVTNIGRWYAFAGAWHTSVMDIGDDDLDGSLALPSADTELDALINGQRGQFVPAGTATGIEYDPYQNATFLSADGEDLFDEWTYRFTNTRYRCRNLSRQRVEEVRSGQQITFPGKLRLLPLQPGDRIRLTSSELAVTNKYYRVTDTQFSYTSPAMLTLVEDDESIWDLADAATVDPTPNSGLASPYIVSQVTLTPAPFSDLTTGVRLSDGTWVPRIKVAWAAITDSYMADTNAKVWVGWRLNSEGTYRWDSYPPDQRVAFISGFAELDFVAVQVYAENQHQIKGPPAYASVNVPFTQNEPGWVTLGAVATRVSGDRAWKVVSADGWDTIAYRANRISGGGKISAEVTVTAMRFMVGFAMTPSGVNSYTSLNFALYNETTTYQVYESGSLIASGLGTPTVGDQVEVQYTGSDIIYKVNGTTVYQHAVDADLYMHPAITIYDHGIVLNGIRVTEMTAAPRGNLINSAVWPMTGGATTLLVAPSIGTAAGSHFTLNESAATENYIVLGTAPDGVLRPIWQCGPAIGGAGAGPDGGWNGGAFPIDPTKTYRSSVWVNIYGGAALDGGVYHGPGGSDVRDFANTVITIPYWHAANRNLFVPGRWYLLVGFILPRDYAGAAPNPAMGGVYDGVTGERVMAPNADYKWATGRVETALRCYQYYTTAGAVQYFWAPRFEMCDGDEPTIKELLAPALESKSIVYDNAFDASFGLNGNFHRWPISATYPTGWALWANAGGISKEVTTVANAPNAIRMTTGGSDTGIVYTINFGSGATPVLGSYVEVRIAGYTVANNSGSGTYGALVRLYTDTGLTTFRDTVLTFNKIAGGWQTQVVNAAVEAGETIYGMSIFLMGSWSAGIPGGAWNGTCIYDKVEVDIKSPKNTTQLVTGSVTQNAVNAGANTAIAVGGSAAGEVTPAQLIDTVTGFVKSQEDSVIDWGISGIVSWLLKNSASFFAEGTNDIWRIWEAQLYNVTTSTIIDTIYLDELHSEYCDHSDTKTSNFSAIKSQRINAGKGQTYKVRIYITKMVVQPRPSDGGGPLNAISTASFTWDAFISERKV
jgi:hypothetical protein